MIGNRCFVTQVRPGSDAEAKGVRTGDEILAINGFVPDRNSLWNMQYVFSVLRPQPSLQLGVRDLAGNQRQVEVAAKIRELKRVTDLTGEGGASDMWELVRQGESNEHLRRVRTVEYGDDLVVLKLPEFLVSPAEGGTSLPKCENTRHSFWT